MITPYDLWVGAVVALVGCAVVATICTWLCDTWLSTAEVSENVLSDLLPVLIFSLGPLFAIPLWWFCFYVMAINGHFWN